MAESSNAQVQWFRTSSPYIHAHRGRTFVVLLGGEVLDTERLPALVHDLALLNTLGIRLVLVHGARPQITRRVQAAGLETRFQQHIRITDAPTLEAVTAAVGSLRLRLEGLFSMGLANSPMHHAGVRLISGNFVIAKPMGVRDGSDYHYTGEVRRIEIGPIRHQLDAGNVVQLSPLGSSPTGELFNLNAEDVASAAAIALGADKLILLGDETRITDTRDQLLRELDPREAGDLLRRGQLGHGSAERQLMAARHAAANGVARVHLLDAREDGVLLKELFTRDGCGTMVTRETYETLRDATIADVGGILGLLAPLEADGTLVRRSRERLENEIRRFIIIERDGMTIACAALYPFAAARVGEIACVVVHPSYRNGERGVQMLRHLQRRAREQGLQRVFVLTTRTAHWFREHGFQPATVQSLPDARQDLYNWQRNSSVFMKAL